MESSTIGTGIDTIVTSLLRQQINPAIIGIMTVTEESSGIVAIGIGIFETQNPNRNHLGFIIAQFRGNR